jgi:hypothetical protein
MLAAVTELGCEMAAIRFRSFRLNCRREGDAMSMLPNCMEALRQLAADGTLADDQRILAAEQAIRNYVSRQPDLAKQMLDVIDRESARGRPIEFWRTLRDFIAQAHC